MLIFLHRETEGQGLNSDRLLNAQYSRPRTNDAMMQLLLTTHPPRSSSSWLACNTPEHTHETQYEHSAHLPVSTSRNTNVWTSVEQTREQRLCTHEKHVLPPSAAERERENGGVAFVFDRKKKYCCNIKQNLTKGRGLEKFVYHYWQRRKKE